MAKRWSAGLTCRPLPRRRNAWIAYVLVEVALFLLANITSHSSNHPGTVSNVFFSAFIAGLLMAALLVVTELVRSRRARR